MVITSALHAEGRWFEPGREQVNYLFRWDYNFLPHSRQLWKFWAKVWRQKRPGKKNHQSFGNFEFSYRAMAVQSNRPRSIYQYSSMAPRLSGQICKFFKFPLSLNSQKRLRYKENNTKYRGLTWKPRSHVTILIYRTWPIVCGLARSVRVSVGETKRLPAIRWRLSAFIRHLHLSCHPRTKTI